MNLVRLVLPSILLFLFSFNCIAQCDTTIVLVGQEAVDNFATDYGCSEIQGSLMINSADNSPVTNLNGLIGLTSIQGKLDFLGSEISNFEGLNNLEYIGGTFYVSPIILSSSYLTSLEGLEQLKYAGKISIYSSKLNNLNGLQSLEETNELKVHSNSEFTSFEGLNSQSVIHSLSIRSNEMLTSLSGLNHLSSLTNLSIINNPSLDNLQALENLATISQDLEIKDNEVLTSLQGLENLSSVTNLMIDENNTISNLLGLNNLSSVTNILIEDNDALTTLIGLDNLTFVPNVSIIENSNLNSLSALIDLGYSKLEIKGNPSLNNLQGLNNLSSIDSLIIDNNDGLISLLELNNLNIVDSLLRITNNSNLLNLAGLNNLSAVGEKLSITSNNLLTNLEGLDNLSAVGSLLIQFNNTISSLEGIENLLALNRIQVTYNPQLSSCCTILDNLANLDTSIVWPNPFISENLEGCNSIEEILIDCDEENNIIKAQAFFDENENGIFDPNEQSLQQSFEISPNPAYAYSNEEGLAYFLTLGLGSFQLSINNLNPLWIANGTETIEISVTEDFDEEQIHYFPMIPVADIAIQEIDLSSSITRCSRNCNYWLTYRNEGTTINSGEVCLNASEFTTLVSADPPVDFSDQGEICWNYENLYPMNSNQIRLVFEMPDFNFIGEPIEFSASVQTNDGQGMAATELSSQLVCAYDPNDKQVLPAGEQDESYTLFGDTLTYTIRFQNTGNDTAFNVIIKDNLSQHLNLNTFEIIANSHPMTTELDIETGIVEFAFNDIFLPDSFVNEPASHGFLKYKILHNENLEENTDIRNEAFIFFDFNPAIVTNTVNNRMVSTIPLAPTYLLNIEEQKINLYPNPSDGNFILKSEFNKIDAVKIYNSHGSIVYQDKGLNNWTNIKLNNFSKGIHIVHLMVDGQVYVRKIVVQW